MIFFGSLETHGNYEDFGTHDILRRFSNTWYFTKVLKPMICIRGFKRRFLKFKKSKILENMFLRNGLTGEITTWINDLAEVLILGNVKLNLVKIIFSCTEYTYK